MASLSPDGKTVIVRIVYAGPSGAGKTTTLYALARELLGHHAEQVVMTPATEQEHTLYFDWCTYQGGRVQGRRLQSHILTVPGLEHLGSRRQLLLQDADAVVFVVDAHRDQMAAAWQAFQEMQPWLQRAATEAAVGVVVQANKQDLPEALSAEDIKQHLGNLAALPVIVTTATTGTGIREAFVKGVGLALERVLVLLHEGRLHPAVAPIQGGEALLQAIKEQENPPPPVREEVPPPAPPEQDTVHEESAFHDAVLLEDILSTRETPAALHGLEMLETVEHERADSAEAALPVTDPEQADVASAPPDVALQPEALPPPQSPPEVVAPLPMPQDGEEQLPKTSPLRQMLSLTIRGALNRIEELTGVRRRDR